MSSLEFPALKAWLHSELPTYNALANESTIYEIVVAHLKAPKFNAEQLSTELRANLNAGREQTHEQNGSDATVFIDNLMDIMGISDTNSTRTVVKQSSSPPRTPSTSATSHSHRSEDRKRSRRTRSQSYRSSSTSDSSPSPYSRIKHKHHHYHKHSSKHHRSERNRSTSVGRKKSKTEERYRPRSRSPRSRDYHRHGRDRSSSSDYYTRHSRPARYDDRSPMRVTTQPLETKNAGSHVPAHGLEPPKYSRGRYRSAEYDEHRERGRDRNNGYKRENGKSSSSTKERSHLPDDLNEMDNAGTRDMGSYNTSGERILTVRLRPKRVMSPPEGTSIFSGPVSGPGTPLDGESITSVHDEMIINTDEDTNDTADSTMFHEIPPPLISPENKLSHLRVTLLEKQHQQQQSLISTLLLKYSEISDESERKDIPHSIGMAMIKLNEITQKLDNYQSSQFHESTATTTATIEPGPPESA